MIPVKDIYDSVRDMVNTSDNGQMKFSQFNRMLSLAENRVMDFLTGDVEDLKPPTPFTSQKLKDWLSPFITLHKANISEDGEMKMPKDFYGWNSMASLGFVAQCSDENEEAKDVYVEILDSGEFTKRIGTSIVGLEPSHNIPICKIIGRSLFFAPKDLGVASFEYIRKPKHGKIVSKIDTVYHKLIIDEEKSIDSEFDEWALELLVYFITERFATNTRETGLMQQNSVVGKLVRDTK